MSPQLLFGMRASFGEDLPAEFTFATQSVLTMALFRAYTGLANDMAGVLAGASPPQRQAALADLSAENLTTRMRRELGVATSETRALVDMQALHTQALRGRASSPGTPYGEAAGAAYGWAPASAGGRSSGTDRGEESQAGPYRSPGYGTYPPSSPHYRRY